jgi:2'-phosphotransferase
MSNFNTYNLKNNKFNHENKISKTMSWILRHGLNELKLEPDELGRIPLKKLIEQEQMKQLCATRELILNIIKSNDKQRFRLEMIDDVEMICANQGHSKEIGDKINSEKLMKKIITPLDLCVHGTYSNVINKIINSGLKIMSRKHIHFATSYPNDKKVISGARSDCDVFIEIDMDLAIKDGIIFYLSSNGVILSDGLNGVIEPKYFKNIIYK